VTFTATDGGLPAQASSVTITITVTDESRAPIIAPVEDRTVAEGGPVAFALTAVDPDGTPISWSSPQLPAGATLDPVGGAFAWTPRYDQSGTYPLTFTATDAGVPARSSSVTVTIHVGDPDAPICTETFDVPGDLAVHPAWTVLAGTWRITPRRMLMSPRKTDALARLSLFAPDGFPFVAGIVSARLKLTAASRRGPNVALVFSLRDGASYRYVRLKPGRVVIGERGGAEATTRARSLTVGRWHDIAVHLHADGLVEVYRGSKRLASHAFPDARPGGLGVATLTAKALVDAFTVQDEIALR
jgi:hypothetical protein